METRNTFQKSLVLKAIQDLHHPTADEVYGLVSAGCPTISRGTVYRNLNVLVEAGKLRRVGIPDGADRFDANVTDHYHIRCSRCGAVADIEMPFQRDIMKQAGYVHGYLIESHDIIFKGICPDCRLPDDIV